MEELQNKQFFFVDTTATRKIFELRKRIRAVAGGTSASKTISILTWGIDYSQKKHDRPILGTITSESYPHLEKGAMLDFQNIMKDRGYWHDDLWNATKHQYTFESGNKMEFAIFDTYEKAHGARRDWLFVNEGNNLPYNIVDQLMVRTRDIVWLDWNPTNEFWFYQNILGVRQDVDFITLTYLDNEALDKNTIAEIESHKNNKQWWDVYGLGKLGTLEAQIYKNWKIIDSIPDNARLVRRGLDFGYSIDATVIEDIYQYEQGFIVDEILYQKGMSNRSIADVLLNRPRVLICADSAEPKSIDEIASYGIPIIGSHKGPGSVYQGIQYVQDQQISITARSVKTIKAQRNYIFLTDKDGLVTNDPDDTIHEWSNPMDAIRYGFTSLKPTQPKKQVTNFGGVKPLYPELGI